jgi:hypothetical protein
METSMAEEENEILVRFDYNDESIVLTETADGDFQPGAHPGEALVEVDPLVEAFARSPYDPVIGAMMMGRATGEVIARPPKGGWMRALALVMAVGMIGQLPVMIYYLYRQEADGFVLASPSLLVSAVFAAGGLLLIHRLMNGSGS